MKKALIVFFTLAAAVPALALASKLPMYRKATVADFERENSFVVANDFTDEITTNVVRIVVVNRTTGETHSAYITDGRKFKQGERVELKSATHPWSNSRNVENLFVK